MRRSLAIVIPFAALLVLVAGCVGGQKPAPVVDQAAVSAAIDSLDQVFGAAVAAKDTNAVVAMYASDAYVFPPNMPRSDGAEAIHRLWAGMLATPGMGLTTKPGPKIVSQSGDMVVDIGTYDLQSMGPRKKPIHDIGKYVTIFKKGDTGWKIVSVTWNSDLAAAAQAK